MGAGDKIEHCCCCGGVPATYRGYDLFVCSSCEVTIEDRQDSTIVTVRARIGSQQKIFVKPKDGLIH